METRARHEPPPRRPKVPVPIATNAAPPGEDKHRAAGGVRGEAEDARLFRGTVAS